MGTAVGQGVTRPFDVLRGIDSRREHAQRAARGRRGFLGQRPLLLGLSLLGSARVRTVVLLEIGPPGARLEHGGR